MPSFFEKLKKGMGIEIPVEEKMEEKPKQKKAELKKLEVKRVEKPPQPEKPKPEVKAEAKVSEIEKPKLETKREEIEVKKEKWFEPEGELAVDVYQTDGEIVIQSAIGGIKPENLDVSIKNDVITIKGKREKPEEKGKRHYFYQECYWGPFSRQIIAPEEIDSSRAQAGMKEGILTIRIPKIQRKEERKIEVKEY